MEEESGKTCVYLWELFTYSITISEVNFKFSIYFNNPFSLLVVKYEFISILAFILSFYFLRDF